MVFARKRFGQNFLQDVGVIEQIVGFLQVKPTDIVIEIGPGRGALTQRLLTRLDRLHVIEIDNDLFIQLNDLPLSHRLNALHADVLKVDFAQFGEKLKIIGNLPYNISTPLLFHLLQYRYRIDDMVFMLQSEVVDKLTAGVSSADYGRLSVMFQYYCDVERLLDVAPHCFMPKPQVMSSVVALRPKHELETVRFEVLEQVVAKAFSMRRKTLANNFKGILVSDDWQQLGISSQIRAQDLSVDEFVKLATYCSNIS